MTEITDEMIRVINHEYLVKGIGAREAIRRIFVLAEEQNSQTTPQTYPEKLCTKLEVMAITGLSISTIYYFMKDGRFPLPLKLTARKILWKHADIIEWINSRQLSEVGKKNRS